MSYGLVGDGDAEFWEEREDDEDAELPVGAKVVPWEDVVVVEGPWVFVPTPERRGVRAFVRRLFRRWS